MIRVLILACLVVAASGAPECFAQSFLAKSALEKEEDPNSPRVLRARLDALYASDGNVELARASLDTSKAEEEEVTFIPKNKWRTGVAATYTFDSDGGFTEGVKPTVALMYNTVVFGSNFGMPVALNFAPTTGAVTPDDKQDKAEALDVPTKPYLALMPYYGLSGSKKSGYLVAHGRLGVVHEKRAVEDTGDVEFNQAQFMIGLEWRHASNGFVAGIEGAHNRFLTKDEFKNVLGFDDDGIESGRIYCYLPLVDFEDVTPTAVQIDVQFSEETSPLFRLGLLVLQTSSS